MGETQPLLPGNSDRMRGDGFMLHQGRVRVGMRNHSYSKEQSGSGTAAHGVGGVTIPGVTQSCGDVALRDVGSGHGGVGRGSQRSFPIVTIL